jgi:hypothetical protein
VQAVRRAILPEQQPLRRGMRQCKVLHGVMDGVGGAITPGSFYFVTAEAEQQRASSPGGDGGRSHRPQTARPAVDMRRPLTAQDTVAGRALPRLWYEVVEYPPMQIKLALAGSGHARKDEVLEAVMRELDLTEPPKPDDAADALAAALTGWFQR